MLQGVFKKFLQTLTTCFLDQYDPTKPTYLGLKVNPNKHTWFSLHFYYDIL